jgi:hypothetical protein
MWFYVRLRSVRRCRQKRQQSSKTNPTGTRSHFVSCIQLRNGIAAVAAIASAQLECCYHMKEVENAQDTADHDGR